MAYVTRNGKLVKVGGIGRNKYQPHAAKIAKALERQKAEAKKSASLKGKENGNCNVTDCQKPGATWWNTSTRAYYCPDCAGEINRWSNHDEGYSICYPSRMAALKANAAFTSDTERLEALTIG